MFLSIVEKMAAKLKIKKRGDEIKKKSSPLKLLSQSQPNFAEMILGLSPLRICVRHFRPPTKMATTAELNLTYDPMGNSHKNLLV
jgi:hypothetical protein